MNIIVNNEACEISFNLSHPIEVSREGDLIEAKKILFKKPSRRVGMIFQNLVARYNSAVMNSLALFEKIASKEDVEKAKNEAEEKKEGEKKGTVIKPKDNFDHITAEKIEEEVVGVLAMMTSLDLDFEKADDLFLRILISSRGRSEVCSVGGVSLTSTHLDKIDYQDYLTMMAVYITFFGKPAKSGTQNESKQQSESVMQAKEV